MEYVPERHDPHIDMILINENNQNFTACEALFWINLHQTRQGSKYWKTGKKLDLIKPNYKSQNMIYLKNKKKINFEIN